MDERKQNALEVAKKSLNFLGIECRIGSDFKEVDGSIFQTVTLSIAGKEVYKETLPIQGSPEDIKKEALEEQARLITQLTEAKSRTDAIVSAADAVLAIASGASADSSD